MDLNTELSLRAHRILTDGLRHDVHARAWAREQVEMNPLPGLTLLALAVEDEQRASLQQVERERFGRLSPREQSLGAQTWV